MNKDSLGDRMKSQYEDRTRYYLPRRTHTIIRIDGKAFHTYTRGCKKPFDHDLMQLMDNTTIELCKQIQGAKFAYVQSDEISILLTDFDRVMTSAWFDGNVQKITSVSASMATQAFAQNISYKQHTETGVSCVFCNFLEYRGQKHAVPKVPQFDSRVFTIPDPEEVINYFIWRQQDSTRNSVQMVARSLYSHKECENKNNSQLQEMIHEAGQNWNDYPVGAKRGRIIKKVLDNSHEDEITTADVKTKWVVDEPPIFTEDRDYLKSIIPQYGYV